MDKKKGKKPGKKGETVPENTPDTSEEIRPDNRIRYAVLLLAIVILGVAVLYGSQLINAVPSRPAGSSGVTVWYFYGDGCEFCKNSTPYVQSMRQKYPDVSFQILEVWYNPANNATLTAMNQRLGQQRFGVPEVFVGDVILLGDKEINAKLESTILDQKKKLTESSQPAGSPASPGSTAGANSSIYATLFYGNGCSHCENVKPLIADLQARYPELQLEKLEINDDKQNREKFLEMQLQHGLGTVGSIPTVFIGDNVLIGETEVRDHFEEKILAEQQKLRNAVPAPATQSPAGLPGGSNGSFNAVFFYGESCSHCEKVKPVITNISSRYPELNLTWLEVNSNAENRQQLIDMSSRFGIPNPGVPTIFIGNHVLIGEAEITNRFEAEVIAERERIATGVPVMTPTPAPVSPGSLPAAPVLSIYLVVFAALVDSTNPCGLSVLVFLLVSMAAAGERKRILLVGGVYIAAMFLFHLFVGIGLFSALALSGLTRPFSLIGGAIALILGIVTLADVLRNRETYLLSIPESGKGLLGTYIRKATLPAAFALGILAGILGFSCTGGIYISILGLMGRDMTVMAGLPWLILYNLVFVLPLVLVTLLVAYGISPDRAERWRTENKRSVRILVGVIMVTLGLVILLGWLG
jgi:cytochrome c biogenesis protein CcdA/thiol-disulfide isomerase/thioredoxin